MDIVSDGCGFAVGTDLLESGGFGGWFTYSLLRMQPGGPFKLGG